MVFARVQLLRMGVVELIVSWKFFFSHSIRALSWVLVSQAGGKRAKRRVPFFSAALWAFAVRPLLGCLNGFASVLFVSPIRAMLRWPNPLEAARETHCAMH